MGTIADMNRKIQSLHLTALAEKVIAAHTDEMEELQKRQLMQGKDNTGALLTPRHSQNPFFKTPQAAQAYARWKQRITPETPFDVPNLFITGEVYHKGISFKVATERVIADSSAPFAGKVEQTYKNKQLGLNNDSKVELWEDTIRNPIVKAVASHLQVKTV